MFIFNNNDVKFVRNKSTQFAQSKFINNNIFNSNENNDRKIDDVSKKSKTNFNEQNNEIDVKNQKQKIQLIYDLFQKKINEFETKCFNEKSTYFRKLIQ